MPILLALFLVFAVVTQVEALEGSQPAASAGVNGDVLYWEGEELIVKEISGREVRLRVTAETKIEGVAGPLKTGDKIAAQVTPEGRALSITLQIPGSGGTAIPPGLH
ncbi:MAG TPA: hypothetical protein VE222_13380 [Nitrospiraceae bacterium]|jgi:hypothetical protein|nr:hypothetical protein [Nitrospiraceae bacterium]